MFDIILNRLRDRKIVLLGFGREGKSSWSFIKKYLPDASVVIADKNAVSVEGNAELVSGPDYLQAIYDADIVIKSPGISLKDFDTKGIEITSQTDLFMSQFHEQTIGVTGTKGKSTTTSLIYHLLKESGNDAVLMGNIGIPCFDVMESMNPNSIAVYELSAHQLEYVHNSPKVGVLLNVFEEHLDHFGTMERYRNAKFNLLRYMRGGNHAIVHESLVEEALRMGVDVWNFSDLKAEVDLDRLPILGLHNQQNVKAALSACSMYFEGQRSMEDSLKVFIPHLYSFKPLEHRLEPVGCFGGVRFYNDSISTIPQAAIAACTTLGRVDFLLLGGFDREIDYTPLVDFLSKVSIPYLLYTGKAGERMMRQAQGLGGQWVPYSSMEEAFDFIAHHAKEGDVCLLSPAAASYDQYKNFEERGRKFKTLATGFHIF